MTPRPKRCLLLSTEDLEAFYYGDDKVLDAPSIFRRDLLRLWSEYGNGDPDDVVFEYPTARDLATIEARGCFPDRLSELQDQYY